MDSLTDNANNGIIFMRMPGTFFGNIEPEFEAIAQPICIPPVLEIVTGVQCSLALNMVIRFHVIYYYYEIGNVAKAIRQCFNWWFTTTSSLINDNPAEPERRKVFFFFISVSRFFGTYYICIVCIYIN